MGRCNIVPTLPHAASQPEFDGGVYSVGNEIIEISNKDVK